MSEEIIHGLLRLELEEWFAQAPRALELGSLLVIDYRDFEPGLWLRQPRGTVESLVLEAIKAGT